MEIAKGNTQFMPRAFIVTGMADVHARIARAGWLRGLTSAGFAEKAGEILGDVNHVHPFREGNGRAQLEYLRQLAAQAGHGLDASRIDASGWHAASRAAHLGDYRPMTDAILRALDASP